MAYPTSHVPEYVCVHCLEAEKGGQCLLCGKDDSHAVGKRYSVIEGMFVPFYPLCDDCVVTFNRLHEKRQLSYADKEAGEVGAVVAH
jgi:hypothetical protein